MHISFVVYNDIKDPSIYLKSCILLLLRPFKM